MKEPIHKYFQVGLISFMAYTENMKGTDPNITQVIKKIACDDYFDAIELNWIKDDTQRAQVAAMLRTAHMTVCYGAQPCLLTTGLNPNHLNEDERQKAQNALMQAIDEAHELGAGGITFLSGKWTPECKDAAFSQLLRTTENLCTYAKTKGLMVELEVFDYDIAKASLIGPAPYAAEFAAQIRKNHSNFGLVIDLSHIPMTYETPQFVVRTLRPYLTHFHIGNTVCGKPGAPAYGDEHPRFGFPGSENDTEQVVAFLRVLRQEGFMDPNHPYVLSFEVKPFEGEDPDIVVANAKRVLNRAWAMLEDL